MSTEPDVISDGKFYAYVHPSQNSRFYLALVFSIILFPVIAAGLIAGTIVLIVPVFAFLIWVGSRMLFAQLLGNSILISNVNYPRVNTIAEELKVKMGYPKPIYIFVFEQGSFNAYMKYFFFRRAIFLTSELLETGVSDDEVRWIVGRFIGYMRARRQAGVLGWVIRAAQQLGIFNFFLLPYERAMVYTGDRLAVAAIDGDISSAISAMQKLLVGRQLGYSVNPEGIIDQQRQVKGSIFAFLARMMTGFPHMTSRYVDLIVFSKAYFPEQYAKFEAVNPGLPEDIRQLAASSQSSAGPREGREAVGRPPHGWLLAAAMLVAVAGLGFVVWNQMMSTGSATTDFQSNPALVEPIPPPPPPPDVAPPAVDITPIPADITAPPVGTLVPDSTPALPPHTHLDAQGQLFPDAGCSWASSDPKDLSVTCK